MKPLKVKVPKKPENKCDVLLVGYDTSSGDIPVLSVGRKKGNEIDILNVLKGPTATEVYNELLHRISVPVIKEETCQPKE
jgi:hypothetical protein